MAEVDAEFRRHGLLDANKEEPEIRSLSELCQSSDGDGKTETVRFGSLPPEIISQGFCTIFYVIHPVRWKGVISEDVQVKVVMKNNEVYKTFFESVYTGP